MPHVFKERKEKKRKEERGKGKGKERKEKREGERGEGGGGRGKGKGKERKEKGKETLLSIKKKIQFIDRKGIGVLNIKMVQFVFQKLQYQDIFLYSIC
jgi:hypothetical protein